MLKRRNHDAAFKARVALEALKGGRTVAELVTAYQVHPPMIHQWSQPLSAIGPRSRHWCAIGSSPMAAACALLEGAAGIFERGGRSAAAEVDEDTFAICMPRSESEPVNATGPRERANAVANDFLARKLKPWTGK